MCANNLMKKGKRLWICSLQNIVRLGEHNSRWFISAEYQPHMHMVNMAISETMAIWERL